MKDSACTKAAASRVFAAALLLGVACGSPAARADATADELSQLKQQLEQSRRVIQQLSDKVDKLEAQVQSQQQAAAVPPAQQEQGEIKQLQQEIKDLAGGMSRRSLAEGLPMHGFIDVGAASSNQGQPKGFDIGRLDFYLTPDLGPRVKGLVELNFEVGSGAPTVGTDLERMQLGYVFSDEFTAWMGRFHTPYGYWNTAFHHGAQIQTSILRPGFLDFEDSGGILASHMVGLWGTGKFNVGPGKLAYDGYVGNGSRIIYGSSAMPGAVPLGGQLDMNLYSDDNHSLAFGGALAYLFSGDLDGLRLGVHGYYMGVDAYDQNNNPVAKSQVGMYGGYGAYIADPWEIMAEFYRFDDENVLGGSGTHQSWAGFFQIARTYLGQWTPYLRGERASLSQQDVYFIAQQAGGSYSRGAAGLRYDLTPSTALKLELERTLETDRLRQEFSQARFQFATRF
ncbi:MAG: hypothetical protein P4L83_23060 [Nevskia sp.]|nr:hypothetical protein [Nevskia sp.]